MSDDTRANMTNKEKQLVLKDLSARLPYEVLCSIGLDYPLPLQRVFIDKLDGILLDFYEDGKDYQVYLSEVKPYLRPLEDMTESERSLYNDLRNALTYQENGEYDLDDFNELNDFLNRNHLDHRGLIEKGLAIRVTKENNPYK